MTTDHERLLHAAYVEDLERQPIEELRTRRAACVDAETGLSYLRRMVQGPLDIVRRELQERADGAGPSDLAELVASLPDALGDHTRPPGAGRLVQQLEPTDLDPELVAELGAVASARKMAMVPEMSDGDLAAFAEELRAYEARVSEQRHQFFGVIDQFQGEITRRYRTGEASVESLLET